METIALTTENMHDYDSVILSAINSAPVGTAFVVAVQDEAVKSGAIDFINHLKEMSVTNGGCHLDIEVRQ